MKKKPSAASAPPRFVVRLDLLMVVGDTRDAWTALHDAADYANRALRAQPLTAQVLDWKFAAAKSKQIRTAKPARKASK